jgi:hypothetical protein
MKEIISTQVWDFILACIIVANNTYDIKQPKIASFKESTQELIRQHLPTNATISCPALLCKSLKLCNHERVAEFVMI